jgi:hypothetical protein
VLELLPEIIADRIGDVTDEGCWTWIGHIERSGYPRVTTKDPELSGDGRIVHLQPARVIWEYLRGPIPEGYWIGHLCHEQAVKRRTCERGPCRHRACVRPDHLFLGDPFLRRGLSHD